MTAYDDIIGKRKPAPQSEEPFIDMEGSFFCAFPGCGLDIENAKYYLNRGVLVWNCPDGHTSTSKDMKF